ADGMDRPRWSHLVGPDLGRLTSSLAVRASESPDRHRDHPPSHGIAGSRGMARSHPYARCPDPRGCPRTLHGLRSADLPRCEPGVPRPPSAYGSLGTAWRAPGIRRHLDRRSGRQGDGRRNRTAGQGGSEARAPVAPPRSLSTGDLALRHPVPGGGAGDPTGPERRIERRGLVPDRPLATGHSRWCRRPGGGGRQPKRSSRISVAAVWISDQSASGALVRVTKSAVMNTLTTPASSSRRAAVGSSTSLPEV